MDIRYLVVTLVAVFLALGFGILVGGVVMGEEGLAARHDALVSHLEAEFERLRAENRRQRVELTALGEEMEAAAAMLWDMMPLAVAGRLTGQRVAVVVTAGETLPGALEPALRSAGAEYLAVIRVATDLDPGEFAERAATVLAGEGDRPGGLAQAIGLALCRPERAGLLGDLEAAGLLAVEGDYRRTPTAVLILGGARSATRARPQEIDLPLAGLLLQHGLRVVAAEGTGTSVSFIQYYLESNIPCLDHLDSPAGLVSLVYLLAGDAGPFGRAADPPALLPRGDGP